LSIFNNYSCSHFGHAALLLFYAHPPLPVHDKEQIITPSSD
jgi:hypothetical protein